MLPFNEWVIFEAKGKKVLPPVKDTGFWTKKFGEGKVDDASAEDLFAHAKKHPKGLKAGIMSLQLLSNYGTFPKNKVKKLWDLYGKDEKK